MVAEGGVAGCGRVVDTIHLIAGVVPGDAPQPLRRMHQPRPQRRAEKPDSVLPRLPVNHIHPIIGLPKVKFEPGSQPHKAEVAIYEGNSTHQGQLLPADVELRDEEAVGRDMVFQAALGQGVVDESEVEQIGADIPQARGAAVQAGGEGGTVIHRDSINGVDKVLCCNSQLTAIARESIPRLVQKTFDRLGIYSQTGMENVLKHVNRGTF